MSIKGRFAVRGILVNEGDQARVWAGGRGTMHIDGTIYDLPYVAGQRSQHFIVTDGESEAVFHNGQIAFARMDAKGCIVIYLED